MKYKRIDMIKFFCYVEEPYKPPHDFVDNKLVRLSETSRQRDKLKLHLECLVDYDSKLRQYIMPTRAGVQKKRNIRWAYITAGLVPKNLDIFKETAPEVRGLGGAVTFEYNTGLGSEEMNNPSKLAPRVVDVVLYHRKGLKVEDYTIDSAYCKNVPDNIELAAENKKGCRLLVIDLEAKLTTNQTH